MGLEIPQSFFEEIKGVELFENPRTFFYVKLLTTDTDRLDCLYKFTLTIVLLTLITVKYIHL